DSAEAELALLGAPARPLHLVEEPLDLRAREIGVEHQPGLAGEKLLLAGPFQPLADAGGPPVLPDDGVVDRLAGGAVPDDRRLALIGDPDGGNVAGGDAALPDGGLDRPQAGCPYFVWNMLHPSRGGEMLGEFHFPDADDLLPVVEDHGSARGGSLVDRQYVSGHSEMAPARSTVSPDRFRCHLGVGFHSKPELRLAPEHVLGPLRPFALTGSSIPAAP